MTDGKKKALKIAQIVIVGILIIFFVFQVVLGIIIRKNAEEAANLPFTIFEITSDSMYPKIKQGDGIIEVNTDYNKLKVGDIITIINDGEFVTHRIVEIDGGMVTTKGDANPYSDAPISQNRYVGRVAMVLPGLSGFLYMTKGWKKAIWIVAILFVLFGPELIVKLSESKREKRNKQKEPERRPEMVKAQNSVRMREISAERPSRQATAERPSRQATVERPSRQATVERPSRQATAERPSRQATAERPSRQVAAEEPGTTLTDREKTVSLGARQWMEHSARRNVRMRKRTENQKNDR